MTNYLKVLSYSQRAPYDLFWISEGPSPNETKRFGAPGGAADWQWAFQAEYYYLLIIKVLSCSTHSGLRDMLSSFLQWKLRNTLFALIYKFHFYTFGRQSVWTVLILYLLQCYTLTWFVFFLQIGWQCLISMNISVLNLT